MILRIINGYKYQTSKKTIIISAMLIKTFTILSQMQVG